MVNVLLKKAQEVHENKYRVHSEILTMKHQLKCIELEENAISKKVAKLGFYLCDSCNQWHKFKEMRMAVKDEGIGSGKCIKCCQNDYFTQLAKSSLNQFGISMYDCPDELLELEKLRAKTRYFIKQKNKQ